MSSAQIVTRVGVWCIVFLALASITGADTIVRLMPPDGPVVEFNCGDDARSALVGCDQLLARDSALFVGEYRQSSLDPNDLPILWARVLFRCAQPPGTRCPSGVGCGECVPFRPHPQDYPAYENTVRIWGTVITVQ